MSHRTIEISTPAYLSLRHRQLVIERDDGTAPTVPIEDLAVLIVDNSQVRYSQVLLAFLAEAKVALIVCGADHMPTGVLLPYSANKLSGERLRAQLDCPRPLAKRLWQAIVASKLRRQGDLLQLAAGHDGGLSSMASRVRSGDPENLEAQGAQRYWPLLFGPAFRRARTADPPNNLLNYGYAVLRAATARAIVSAGLIAGLGLFHANRSDAFALASDLMEPFRPFVDGIAWELLHAGLVRAQLNRTEKAHLLAVLNLGVTIDGQTMPISLALHRAAASLAESFASRKMVARLPEGPAGLPGKVEEYNGSAAPPAA